MKLLYNLGGNWGQFWLLEFLNLRTLTNLLQANYVNESYLEKVTEALVENPLAMSIAPGCLLLHHHFKYGSYQKGASVVYLPQGYPLKKGKDVVLIYLLFLVATAEDMSHVPIIFSVDTALKNGLLGAVQKANSVAVIENF
ncbi:MAG: hypothetical protein ACRC6X_02470 [Culicoidibacterales bacterium]